MVRSALELLERNRRLLAGKNPWAAALWLASFRKLGLLMRLAEAAGATPTSIRNATNRIGYTRYSNVLKGDIASLLWLGW